MIPNKCSEHINSTKREWCDNSRARNAKSLAGAQTHPPSIYARHCCANCWELEDDSDSCSCLHSSFQALTWPLVFLQNKRDEQRNYSPVPPPATHLLFSSFLSCKEALISSPCFPWGTKHSPFLSAPGKMASQLCLYSSFWAKGTKMANPILSSPSSFVCLAQWVPS